MIAKKVYCVCVKTKSFDFGEKQFHSKSSCLHGTTSDLPWVYPSKTVTLHRDTLHHIIVPLFCFPADGRDFFFRFYFLADSACKSKN